MEACFNKMFLFWISSIIFLEIQNRMEQDEPKPCHNFLKLYVTLSIAFAQIWHCFWLFYTFSHYMKTVILPEPQFS